MESYRASYIHWHYLIYRRISFHNYKTRNRSRFWKKRKFLIFLTDFKVLLTSTDQIEVNQLAQTIFAQNLEGINRQEFSSNKYLDYLIQEDILMTESTNNLYINKFYWITSKNCKRTLHKIQLETSEFKELTGLSRKYAIPLLEWLDQQLFTKRQENYRIRGDALFNHSLLTKIG